MKPSTKAKLKIARKIAPSCSTWKQLEKDSQLSEKTLRDNRVFPGGKNDLNNATAATTVIPSMSLGVFPATAPAAKHTTPNMVVEGTAANGSAVVQSRHDKAMEYDRKQLVDKAKTLRYRGEALRDLREQWDASTDPYELVYEIRQHSEWFVQDTCRLYEHIADHGQHQIEGDDLRELYSQMAYSAHQAVEALERLEDHEEIMGEYWEQNYPEHMRMSSLSQTIPEALHAAYQVIADAWAICDDPNVPQPKPEWLLPMGDGEPNTHTDIVWDDDGEMAEFADQYNIPPEHIEALMGNAPFEINNSENKPQLAVNRWATGTDGAHYNLLRALHLDESEAMDDEAVNLLRSIQNETRWRALSEKHALFRGIVAKGHSSGRQHEWGAVWPNHPVGTVFTLEAPTSWSFDSDVSAGMAGWVFEHSWVERPEGKVFDKVPNDSVRRIASTTDNEYGQPLDARVMFVASGASGPQVAKMGFPDNAYYGESEAVLAQAQMCRITGREDFEVTNKDGTIERQVVLQVQFLPPGASNDNRWEIPE